jgi:hypothetical protein
LPAAFIARQLAQRLCCTPDNAPRSCRPSLQAASIHPCQHANVMLKLAERVTGEGREFEVER